MEANNGRRDEIQGAGVEEQAAHDACDMHDSSLLDELYNLVVEADDQEQGELSVIPPSTSTSIAHLGARQALSTHTYYPRIDNDVVSGRRKKRTAEKYPSAVTSEKWRQMYKEREDAKKKDEKEKQAKKEEREKKRKLNEELKMKRMQERNDRQKKKNEEKQQRVQTKINKHKRKSTNEIEHNRKSAKRNPCTVCEESVGATGPGKIGLQCSRCRDKVHVSCVGKAHLIYFAGYDDSDDEDFEYHCTSCFTLDENSSLDVSTSESD